MTKHNGFAEVQQPFGHEASVRELREQLAEHLQKVSAGATLVVTSRGQPVARLIPYAQPKPRQRGFFKGQIVFHDGWEDTPQDVLASIDAELEPPAPRRR
jgi:prevent-host-death family protein